MHAAILYEHATTEADTRITAALDAELAAVDDDQAGDDAGPDDDNGGPGALVPAGRTTAVAHTWRMALSLPRRPIVYEEPVLR